ncbi:MAG: hypothetical protein ACOYT4_01240 [Nanoarchaeota archaeon]
MVDEELANWIKSAKEKGYNSQQIRDILVNKNYNAYEIDEALSSIAGINLESQNEVANSTESAKKNSSGKKIIFIVIIILFFIAILASAGFIYWTQHYGTVILETENTTLIDNSQISNETEYIEPIQNESETYIPLASNFEISMNTSKDTYNIGELFANSTYEIKYSGNENIEMLSLFGETSSYLNYTVYSFETISFFPGTNQISEFQAFAQDNITEGTIQHTDSFNKSGIYTYTIYLYDCNTINNEFNISNCNLDLGKVKDLILINPLIQETKNINVTL